MRLLALTALLAAPALAQPVVLTPGHSDLALDAVVPQSRVAAVTMVGPQPRMLGTVRDDVRLDDGVLTVVTSTAVEMAGPPTRDSTLFAWPSLRPVLHVVESNEAGGAVRFAEGSVSGEWGPVGEPSPLAFDLERPVFAAAALPYIVRALPLDRTGYQAAVPLFSAKERFQEATLTVVGPETATVDGVEMEVVAVEQAGGGGLTRGYAQRHLVDPVTREIVRTALAPAGMDIAIDPAPPEVAATAWPLRARPAAPVALVPGHPDLALDRVPLASGDSEMRYVSPERRALWHISETVARDGDTVTVAMSAFLLSDSTRTLRITTRYRWPSLAPIDYDYVSVNAEGETVRSLSFDGLRVTGAYGEAGTELPLDLELSAPAFGPRSVALVAQALPFRVGYAATVPVFSAEDRLTTYTLAVIGRADVDGPDGTVSAWIVEQTGDGPTRRYAVHPETRALLSSTYAPRPGALIETVRLAEGAQR